MQTRTILIGAAATFLTAGIAQGGMMGQEVQVSHAYNDTTYTSANAVVFDGVEFPSFMGRPTYSVDISDTQIRIFNFTNYQAYPGSTDFTPGTFNGVVFQDLNGTIADFAGFTVDASTNIAGLMTDRLTYDSDHLYANFQGLWYDPSTQIVLNVAVIPEPGTLGLLLPFGGLALLRRRK